MRLLFIILLLLLLFVWSSRRVEPLTPSCGCRQLITHCRANCRRTVEHARPNLDHRYRSCVRNCLRENAGICGSHCVGQPVDDPWN